MDNWKEFKKIESLKPALRGLKFEALLNKILDEEGILIVKSYTTEDGEQQIDGAIEINGRIFLLEIKWERSDTLAASKLFSFVGKVNSKIEGTLGIFISYNKLSSHFESSLRNGLRQNILLIHGPNNIEEMIKRDLKWGEYIWYIFRKSSTVNSHTAEISEYLAESPKSGKKSANNDEWELIYDCIRDEQKTVPDLIALISKDYESAANNLQTSLEIYPYVMKPSSKLKLDEFLKKARSVNKKRFNNAIVDLLESDDWRKFATEEFAEQFIKGVSIPLKKQEAITNVLCDYLDTAGDWDNENAATYVIQELFDELDDNLRRRVIRSYIPIFIDSMRKSKFAQKRFANEIIVSKHKKLILPEFKGYVQKGMEEASARYFDDESEKEAVLRYLRNLEYKAAKISQLLDEDVIEDFKYAEEAADD